MPISPLTNLLRSDPAKASGQIQRAIIASDLDMPKAAAALGIGYRTLLNAVTKLNLSTWIDEKRAQKKKAIATGDRRRMPRPKPWKSSAQAPTTTERKEPDPVDSSGNGSPPAQ